MRAAFAVAFVLALIIFGLRPGETVAEWTNSESAEAVFTASSLGSVQDLRCYDEDNGILGGLGIDLVRGELAVVWDPPSNPPPETDPPIEYVVSIGGDQIATTSNTYHVIDTDALLLGLNAFTMSVRPQLGEWTADAQSVSGIRIQLLTIIIAECSA